MTELTKENFEEEINGSELPILIDFWATLCAPCKMMTSIINELEEDLSEQIKIYKANIENVFEYASKYEISSVPTLIIIKDDKIVARQVGLKSKEDILEFIKEAL